MHALLISLFDEETAVLTLILQKAGFSIRTQKDFSKLITSWPEQPVDFILVAISESDANFLKEIRQIRLHSAAPILLVSDPMVESSQVDLLETANRSLALTADRTWKLSGSIPWNWPRCANINLNQEVKKFSQKKLGISPQ